MKEFTKITPPFPTGQDGSFVSGNRASNPIKIDYFVNTDMNNTLFAEIICDKNSSGPPGHVHGGCQAAILDELMGSCAWQFSYSVVAIDIKVRFLKMLPIDLPIKGGAKIEKVQGNQVFVTAKLYKDDIIYSNSEGIFHILSQEKVEKLKQHL